VVRLWCMDSRFLAPAPDAPVTPGTRPTFSVVIAAYQAAATIGDALESVFAQTERAHEVVVVDDGSTDDLATAVAPYRDRIMFIRKENGGVASARNMALDAASGDFLVILDADDRFFPGRLEALADMAVERPDLDVLTTDSLMTLDGEVVRRYYDNGLTFEVDHQLERLLRGNFVYPLAAVRRERVAAVGGFDEQLLSASDWEIWLRLALDGSRVGLVDEPLAEYRLSGSSISSDGPRMARACMAVIDKHRDDRRLTDEQRTILDDAHRDFELELAREEARVALRGDAPGARRKLLRVAAGGGQPRRTRVKALLAAISPHTATRRLRGSAAQYLTGGYTVADEYAPFGRGMPVLDTEEVFMLIGAIVVVCILLLILGFLVPRLSRGPQKGVDKTLGLGSRGASKAPGPLGRWFSKPFRTSMKAADKSASTGRRGRSKLNV
jgi:Family of unknown function (DUF6411)/Glycosyl transferase family 2